ncbi:MAG: hypothetical protein RL660_3060 [Bacteroidota bacterium]
MNAKPRFVDIDAELKNASTIEFCKIIDYTDSNIVYEKDFLKTTGNIVETKRVKSIAKLSSYEKSFIGIMVTGGIPKINENCLIVIDTSGFVSLFGKKINENIIFWSPIYTGSACLIKHSELFTTYEKYNDVDSNKDLLLTWTSVKISFDDFNKNFKHRIIECGSALFKEKKVLFIPDLVDGRAYEIENAKEFDIKDKSNFCIEGDLLETKVTIVKRIN